MESFSVTFALAAPGQAALWFGCSTLGVQWLGPLVKPGNIPSQHVHQIVGGNAFGGNMKGDIGEQATCITCIFSEDSSNYWAALLYFRAPNGTYKRVPLYPTSPRSPAAAPAKRCWDGKNIDSPGHHSPKRPCGTRRGSTTYDPWTARRARSPGATTYVEGYGAHADYVFGWKGDSPQRAMDSDYMFQGCGASVLEMQSAADMNECGVESSVAEDVEGYKISRACLVEAP
ncbi:hypothetical protein DL771_002717 [Monosporascus sp. 5C6A]|nr:hypothetical protein DL771_002717 [Monosporascus sp. 5C6A]